MAPPSPESLLTLSPWLPASVPISVWLLAALGAWLLLLPFRLVGITFSALFAFLHALLMLPARLLGWKPSVPVAA